MNIKRTYYYVSFMLIALSVGFIIYFNADLLQNLASANDKPIDAKKSEAKRSDTPPNNAEKESAVYADLEKRLEAIRKQ
jgi:hypothetical protein